MTISTLVYLAPFAFLMSVVLGNRISNAIESAAWAV